MGIARLRDGAAGLLASARVLGRNQTHKRHHTGSRREAPRVTQLGGDRKRRQIIDAAETPQPLDARLQGLHRQQSSQVVLYRSQSTQRFIDGAEIRPMGLLERRQRPALRSEPHVVPLRPRPLCLSEPAPMPQEKLRQSVSRAQHVRANVLPTAEQVPGGLLLLGRDVDRGQRARAIEHR